MPVADVETLKLEERAKTPAGALRLVVLTEDGVSSHALPASGLVVIGRGEDATIRVDDRAMSRRHVAIHLGPELRLQDLGSSNGVFVRGARLPDQGSVALEVGDSFELGTSLATLQPDLLAAAPRPWSLHTHARFVDALSTQKAPVGVVRLEVQGPPGVSQQVLSEALDADELVASFGPGLYEILLPRSGADEAKLLAAELSAGLVARGCRVRAGWAAAPLDGTTPDELLAACARPATTPASGFVVHDDAMAALYRLVDRVAPSQINVLVLGETGAGKEVLAQELHRRSKRAGGPFLKLNCAALTETLLESELFGHEKGAFTGAIKTKPGLLEVAAGGTVFLDEIGEVPASTQTKLLRVLEERKVLRVGATAPTSIDVRFLFATNRDLEAEVARGAFRADLYYRINGLSLVLPPLRERRSEIEPLARLFAAQAAERDGRRVPDFTAEALAALRDWPWPGNIRQLRNVIDRAALLAGDAPISVQALGLTRPAAKPDEGQGLREEREAAEKKAVLEALDKAQGNQTRAAELLGVSRRTLVTRLTRYGLTRPRK